MYCLNEFFQSGFDRKNQRLFKCIAESGDHFVLKTVLLYAGKELYIYIYIYIYIAG